MILALRDGKALDYYYHISQQQVNHFYGSGKVTFWYSAKLNNAINNTD